MKISDKNSQIELFFAIFAIAAVSVFVLANLLLGYNLYLYAFAALAGFVVSVFRPRAGVLAIVFLTFVFERFFTLVPVFWNRAEYKIYPLDILFAGVLIGTILQYFARHLETRFPSGNRVSKWRIVDWLVAIFILASSAYFFASAYLFRADTAVAFSTFKNYAFYGLFYFAIVYLFNSKESLFRLLKFALAGAIAITIFIFIGAVRGEGLWTEFTPLSTPGTRILAFPHSFFLSMAVLIALAYFAFGKFKSRVSKNIFIVLVPVWLLGIAGSLMRHLWISLFVSLVVMIAMLPKENRKKLRNIFIHYAFLIFILIALLGYVAVLFPDLGISKTFWSAAGVAGKRFISTANVSTDESLNWRKNVWQSAWEDFKKTPVFGIGYGKKLSVEIGTKYKDFVEVRNIHNSLLTVFIQMGIWSVGLAAAAFWLIAKSVFKNLKHLRSLPKSGDELLLLIVFFALFVNYSIAFLFQTYLETNLLGMFFWVIMGSLRSYGFYELRNERTTKICKQENA
jgi:O-antigen ligase